MPKRKVNEEVTAQIQRLKAHGGKDSEIAHKLGLDPRTVRSALKKIGKAVDYEHWTAVSRQVDSMLLQKHYNELTDLVISIQNQLTSDLSDLPRSHSSFQRSKSLELVLNGLFKETTPGSLTREPSQTIPTRLAHEVRGDRRQALGNRLLEGLLTHEPELREALNKCYDVFDNCQTVKGSLWREAESTLKKGLLEQTQLNQIGRVMIQEVCEQAINSVGKGLFDIREEPNEAQVYVFRRVGRSDLKTYCGSQEGAKDACQEYERVLALLSQTRMLERFKIAADELPRLREQVDGLIDTILLRGRPNGRCDLCPYALLSNPS